MGGRRGAPGLILLCASPSLALPDLFASPNHFPRLTTSLPSPLLPSPLPFPFTISGGACWLVTSPTPFWGLRLPSPLPCHVPPFRGGLLSHGRCLSLTWWVGMPSRAGSEPGSEVPFSSPRLPCKCSGASLQPRSSRQTLHPPTPRHPSLFLKQSPLADPRTGADSNKYRCDLLHTWLVCPAQRTQASFPIFQLQVLKDGDAVWPRGGRWTA